MPPFRKAGSVRYVGWVSFHELLLYLIVPPATATGFTGTVVVTKAVTSGHNPYKQELAQQHR
jgi:hypothetical protein